MNKQQKQIHKSRTSRLAVSALVIPVVLWGSGICILGAFRSFSRDTVPKGLNLVIERSATTLVLFSGVVGIVLGALAVALINESKGMLKGKRFAIEAIIVSVVLESAFFVFLFLIVAIKGR